MKKLTIEEMRSIAVERGGKCLSDIYVNNHTKLLWECAKGHRWEMIPSGVRNCGQWCPKCYDSRRGASQRLSIEMMQEIAKQRSGECLSKSYKNARSQLKWRCSEGHKWEATPDSIKRGSWCPHCTGNADGTIEEMHIIAKKRDGKCLSKVYKGTNTKLLWECAEKHRWETKPSKIKIGRWCPICYNKRRGMSLRLNIEMMQRIAQAKGGKCLSDTYVNNATKLLWQCAQRHQWKARPQNIINGTWCPKCSSGLGERICREFFEQIFGKKFPKSYPNWLVNKRGNQMELDGYCQSLALAFEHQGEQHYSHLTHFTKTAEDFQQRQEDDKSKRGLCTKHGIVLIELPEIPKLLSVGEIKAFIKEKCDPNGIPLPCNFDTKKINLKVAYVTSGAIEAKKEMQRIAKERGGKCLSKTYISSITKHLWECKKRHQWKATPNKIKGGRWCPECGGTVKRNIEEMRRIVKERGGECLSNTYINARTSLLWECDDGHQWEAAPYNIKSGRWCPHCAGKVKGTIEEMQEIAEEHSGKCLSELYVNDRTKLLWECAKGHQWEATPSNVKRGSWCRECVYITRKSRKTVT